MSTNQELYKQAILDAKAVRESALANAKSVLSETFEPRIKEMMRLKLSEELEEVEETEETLDNIVDTNMGEVKTSNMEESTLDDILAELDAIENEGKQSADDLKPMNEEAEEAEEETEEEESSEEEVMGDGEEVEDDTEVVDITVGEFKEIIRDLFNTLQSGGKAMDDMQDTADAEMQAGEEEEISLEEIIAQLEGIDDAEEDEMLEPMEEAKKAMKKKEEKKMEDKDEEKKEMAKELKEAIKTIQSLKSELNEINLLNAKLLYVNKLFKSKSLNESQKVKVLNAFDRATTVKEAENTYKTLNESLSLTKKSTIKESVGFASKPMGNAPAKPIVEHDASVSRWQHLAGIK